MDNPVGAGAVCAGRSGTAAPGRKLVVLASLAIAVGTLLPASAETAQVPSIGVIPDTEGAIAEVTIHYDSDLDAELRPFYSDLFAALAWQIDVKVLARSSADARLFLRRWAKPAAAGGRSVTVMNMDMELSIWARDRRIARQSRTLGPTFEPIVPGVHIYDEPAKINELEAPWIISDAALDVAPFLTDFFIEGGNVVSNFQEAFIGSNVLADNCDLYADEADLLRLLRAALGRPIVLVSDMEGTVPWDHVDMYLTPLDDLTVLVADVGLVDALWPEAPLPDAAAEHGYSEDSIDVARFDGDGWSWSSPNSLDEVAGEFERRGFTVGRLPAIVDAQDAWMITYNNVLMERRGGRRIVYMPIYEEPALDTLASTIYAGWGFEVRPVNVSRLYEYGGAIRCIVNVTRREPSVVAMARDTQTPPPAGTITYFDLGFDESAEDLGSPDALMVVGGADPLCDPD